MSEAKCKFLIDMPGAPPATIGSRAPKALASRFTHPLRANGDPKRSRRNGRLADRRWPPGGLTNRVPTPIVYISAKGWGTGFFPPPHDRKV